MELTLVDMFPLQQIFRPHQFTDGDGNYIDLYHLYDNLSRTPYYHGIGIECEVPDEYFMSAWHVITSLAMRRHLDWRNRDPSQFVSFYDNTADAQREFHRRWNQSFVPGVGTRFSNSVRMAHVRLPRGTNVWFFSRVEMLNMMSALGGANVYQVSGASEWFVWGVVPNELVLNRHLL